MLTAASSDRCATCSAPLASDQRYCINCGERRGKPRFLSQQRTEAPVAAPRQRERRVRAPAGLSLIAGVATLLLAMGVGVLIGQDSSSNSKQPSQPAAQVITVNGGGGAGTSSVATTASTNGSSKPSKGKKNKAPVAKLTKKTTAVINQNVSNVVGNQAKLAPPQTKLGGSCTNGQAGCQNGKFTGGFFTGGN